MKNVLVVDDSFFVRRILGDLIEEIPNFTVIDSVQNGKIALESLEEHDVDVMTLDLEMPELDGIETLRALQDREEDVPVIMITSHGEEKAELGAKALEHGVVRMIDKPDAEESGVPKIDLLEEELHETLEALDDEKTLNQDSTKSTDDLSEILANREDFDPKLMVVGGSTGAPAHLRTLLRTLPGDFPLPIVVVQHISEPFLTGLAENLDKNSDLTVEKASKSTELEAGHVYLPAEEKHIIVRPNGENYAVHTAGVNPVNSACPSVDVLFESAAQIGNGNVIAVLFTGMGRDGARGMKKIHDQGGLCLAQNKESSTVYGMPGEADKLGAVDYSFSPDELPGILKKIVERIKT